MSLYQIFSSQPGPQSCETEMGWWSMGNPAMRAKEILAGARSGYINAQIHGAEHPFFADSEQRWFEQYIFGIDLLVRDETLAIENRARASFGGRLTGEQTAWYFTATPIAAGSTLTLDSQAIHAEAAEEGYDQPPAEALEGAECVLRRFPSLRGLDPDIYPTPDAEVAILASGSRPRSSVLLQCDGKGQVRCSVSLDGRHRRALYDKESFDDLRDDFIAAALAELDA